MISDDLVVHFLNCVIKCEMTYVYFFFFQAEDGIRDLVRSRGLGDVYKRQVDTFGIPNFY